MARSSWSYACAHCGATDGPFRSAERAADFASAHHAEAHPWEDPSTAPRIVGGLDDARPLQ